jgi:capsular polysaccharide biosynthesis protein
LVSAVTAEKLAQNPVLVSTLDDATWPDPRLPRRPIVWLNLLVAALAGLVLALAYAFLADHFDHSIKSVDEAERYLGVPVLVSVPKISGRIISHT